MTGATPDTADAVDVLGALNADHYTLTGCSILPYDCRDSSTFGRHLLPQLYDLCLASRPNHPSGILPETFCGMLNLSADAICSYLATRPLLLLTAQHIPNREDVSDRYRLLDGPFIAGFSFITAFIGTPVAGAPNLPPSGPQPIGPRSAVGACCFFRPYWGAQSAKTLLMLTLAYWFNTYHLSSIHAQRYTRNHLIASFLAPFGFKDTGTVPEFLADRDGSEPSSPIALSSCTVSTLTRSDLVSYIERQLPALLLSPNTSPTLHR